LNKDSGFLKIGLGFCCHRLRFTYIIIYSGWVIYKLPPIKPDMEE